MKFQNCCLLLLLVVALAGGIRTVGADRVDQPPAGPVRIVTTEPGVVPKGTLLVVRTNDPVSTDRAFRSTIYEGSLSEDVIDQNEKVLIPKESPVDLSVFSFRFLGPGGGGMSELVLGVRAVTVNGVTYPVETAEPQRDGGLGANSHTPKWVGGNGEVGRVLTRGRRINVPTGALLSFQTDEPIRLRGYHR